MDSTSSHPKNPAMYVGKTKKTKKKMKSKTSKLFIEHHVDIYDVISELARVSSVHSFGKLAPGEAGEGEKKLLRILPPGGKSKRIFAAPLSEVPRRPKIIRIAIADIEAESLFDSSAIPKLVSSKLCQELSLNVVETDRRITVTNEHKSGVTGIVTDVPISLGKNIVVSMDCLEIDSHLFYFIIGQPALEAFQAVIYFSKQKVRPTVGAKSNILAFDYASARMLEGDASDTE